MPKQPSQMIFEGPSDAKGFNALVNLDSSNVDIAKGITGIIDFKKLGVQCLAIYGCLLRKEDIAAASLPISKSRIASQSYRLSKHPIDFRRASSPGLQILLLTTEEL